MDPLPFQKSNADSQKTSATKGPKAQDSETQRQQPWKQLLGEIEKEAKSTPVGEDFFPCKNGFSDHSLAA